MFWGCIIYDGMREPILVDVSRDSIAYVQILSIVLHVFANMRGLGDDFIFNRIILPTTNLNLQRDSLKKTI